MFHWILNCREVTRRVSESLDRKLPLAQQIGIRIHFLMCRICPEAKRQMLFLREAARRLSEETMPPESGGLLSSEARDRIRRALIEK